jgi:hypothetical protein
MRGALFHSGGEGRNNLRHGHLSPAASCRYVLRLVRAVVHFVCMADMLVLGGKGRRCEQRNQEQSGKYLLHALTLARLGEVE